MKPIRNTQWICSVCKCEFLSREDAEKCCVCARCKTFSKQDTYALCDYCVYTADGVVNELVEDAKEGVQKAKAHLEQVKQDIRRHKAIMKQIERKQGGR
jgi:hypothetical protein